MNIKEQIDALVKLMPLKEKIGQLTQIETPIKENVEAVKSMVRRGEVGSILMSVGATAGNDKQGAIDVTFYNELQRIAIEESPHHIPLLFGRDVIHGHRTVYPIPLAMAASFDFDLIQHCYRNIAVEAANESVHWSFAPMLDLARDPRWGRIIECPGEDPLLGKKMANAVVNGLQGDDLKAEGSLLACAKHFIGYGAAEGGRDYHHTEISDYSLYNYYLPSFREAVNNGVATVMSAFNDINGEPVSGSKYYLTNILREKLGFNGFVVSDYAAIHQLIHNGVAENDFEASIRAIDAGVDMDMWDACYLDNLEQAVKDGKISESIIDNAVKRVLEAKLKKGLFEKPYCEPKPYDRKRHLNDARKLAAESAVLLKNDGSILPLSKNSRVSLIGPFAEERRSLLGSWTIDGKADETPNLAEAMREAVKGSGSVYTEYRADNLSANTVWVMRRSEAIVLALGESWADTGENRSRANIDLSVEQKELIIKAKATGKKLIGVFFCGRNIPMQGIVEYFDAVIYAWHSGSEAAGAVADIIYGKVNPQGRLPVTIPRLATHIPIYYNCYSSGHDVNGYYGENPDESYVDSLASPYYPFGYGLSYTNFEYGNISCENLGISIDGIKNDEYFEFEISLKNVGNCFGTETVQLYIHDKFAGLSRPLRELKDFKKVSLNPGEATKVKFKIGIDELGYYMPDGRYIIEKGEFDIYISEKIH